VCVYVCMYVYTISTPYICAYTGVSLPIHMYTSIHKHIRTKSTD